MQLEAPRHVFALSVASVWSHELVFTDITHLLASHFRYRKKYSESYMRPIMFLLHRLTSSRLCNHRTMTFIEPARKWTLSEVRTCIVRSSLLRASHTFFVIRFTARVHSRARIYSFASAWRMMKIASFSFFASVTYAYRPASRALHVPIKSFSNFVRRAIGAHASLLYLSLAERYSMTRQNFFLDIGARGIAGIEKPLPPPHPFPSASFIRERWTISCSE